MKLPAELLAGGLQNVGIVVPVAPTRGDGFQHHREKRVLLLSLQQLCVFVILNTVADSFQADSRSRFRRSDRRRRIKKDSVTRSAQSTAASRRIHVVPTAYCVSGRPAV